MWNADWEAERAGEDRPTCKFPLFASFRQGQPVNCAFAGSPGTGSFQWVFQGSECFNGSVSRGQSR